MSDWTVEKAIESYGIERWGGGHFTATPEGNIALRAKGHTVDLMQLIGEVRQRGIDLPVLLRFLDILDARVGVLNEAFQTAMKEYGYKGTYRGVFPIKVNQQRHVVERLMRGGEKYHHGLEVGSKPELLAALALIDDDESLLICNGYKDEEYIETALRSLVLHPRIIIVLEQTEELAAIEEASRRLGVKPLLGVRCKLSSKGSGLWESSGGDAAKFGLTAAEILDVVLELRKSDMLDSLVLLHFHIGSQISAISRLKRGLKEANRFFVELNKMGAKLQYFDCGGGLGVDYDGSNSSNSSSKNYSVQEYANDVVYSILESCDEFDLPHPTIVTESGRALAAHHSVLVFNVLGVTSLATDVDRETLQASSGGPLPEVAEAMFELIDGLDERNFIERFHDAQELKGECLSLFTHGLISLQERALAEKVFWAFCTRLLVFLRKRGSVPSEMSLLQRRLADIYYCNFSLFQSLPDAWAVSQVFPVSPMHRLAEEPDRFAVLADLTCDSDGKMDCFAGDESERHKVLRLHTAGADDYLLGVFLVGAYQEILGDLHNLFGDTNSVHVSVDTDGHYVIEDVVLGDTVAEVLHYVQYNPEDLVARLRRKAERALKRGSITLRQSRELVRSYAEGLQGYTYLEQGESAEG